MNTFLTILLVFACFLIVAAVLLQPSKEGGMTPFGGSSQSVFGSTGGTTFLFRLTMWTAAFIGVVSLYLSRSKIQQGKASVIDSSINLPALPTAPAPAPLAPVNPAKTATAPQAPAPVGSPPATPSQAAPAHPEAPHK